MPAPYVGGRRLREQRALSSATSAGDQANDTSTTTAGPVLVPLGTCRSSGAAVCLCQSKQAEAFEEVPQRAH